MLSSRPIPAHKWTVFKRYRLKVAVVIRPSLFKMYAILIRQTACPRSLDLRQHAHDFVQVKGWWQMALGDGKNIVKLYSKSYRLH